MRHHLDEFSVTDIRHTMSEAWRIVCHRRWFFVFPFCMVSTAALLCSLLVPRQYTARTVIKCEQDPIFANMMGADWTQPYAQIRKRMRDDLRNAGVILQVLEELNLPRGLDRFENGEFTPRGQSARRALAGRISNKLEITPLSSSENPDVFSISLSLLDPEHVPEILRRIRDRYIASARGKTIEVLRDVEHFYRTESERCRAEVGQLQRQLAENVQKYPGIDPDVPDPTRSEEARLVVERVDLERKLSELMSEHKRILGKLAATDASEGDRQPAARGIATFRPNPRHAELTREISRLLREIADNQALRGMTAQHPVIRQLRTTLAMRQDELLRTAPDWKAASPIAEGRGFAVPDQFAGQPLEFRLAEIEESIGAREARLVAVEARVSRIHQDRAVCLKPREAYLHTRRQVQRLSGELESLQANIGSIERIFMMEDRDRTINFATVQDAMPITRPSSPNAKIATLICFAIGVAFGIMAVLISELVDRSYRTVKHLKTSLGLPVIESIDEIVTEAMRKRRMVRNLVLMPAAALACISTMIIAGALAYLSIDSPGNYDLLISAPSRAYQMIIG